MIEEGIDSLESEAARIHARAALATLVQMGVFDLQKRINTAALLIGSPTESIENVLKLVMEVRSQNATLDSLADLGRSFIKKD